MPKPNVLLQFDTDPHVSSFDSLVAVDSGVDHLLRYPDVSANQLESLVHGAMFTRGGDDLRRTALYFGGSNVANSIQLFAAAKKCFFGNIRVSAMADPNGSNTTAAAAVLSAERHQDLEGSEVVVLAGTGPVGLRISQLVCELGGRVKLCSRRLQNAEQACEFLKKQMVEPKSGGLIEPHEVSTPTAALTIAAASGIVFAAGAAGICLLEPGWESANTIPNVVIDVNAVPPSGIAGVAVTDFGKKIGDTIAYGAIGVGGLKMKIHKRCIQSLFESNELLLDTREIYQIGRDLIGTSAP